jgi:O-antigen ligase
MEAIAVIAAVVAGIWGIVFFLRSGLLGGCLAVLLAGTCFGLPLVKIELGPLPLSIDRALLVLLVGEYLLWRRFGWVNPKPLGRPEIVLLLFTAVMVASTFSADWRASNYQPVAWLIIYYLMPAVVYWIARQADFSGRTMLALFACFTIFGIYLALTSLAEYFKLWGLVFPGYIATTAAEPGAEFVGRARGPLLNPIANGILLAICLGSLLLWWPWFNRRGQLLLLLLIPLFLAGIAGSLTRSVWMGGLFALALAAGLTLPWSWRLPLLGGGLLAAVLVTVTEWENLLAFKRDEALAAEKTAESVELRPILATVAWHMFLDRPLLGCGYWQYKTEHKNYVSDRSTSLPLERGRGYIPHNVLLSLLTETGLAGLGLFAAMVFYWTRDAWRLWRTAALPLWARQQGLWMMIALGAYFINGMFHDVSVMAMMNLTLFFLAGVTAGLRPRLEPAAAGGGPDSSAIGVPRARDGFDAG